MRLYKYMNARVYANNLLPVADWDQEDGKDDRKSTGNEST